MSRDPVLRRCGCDRGDGQVIGDADEPYNLYIPTWLARLIWERYGMSAQEYADQAYIPHVNVVVV
jgi:hypothetical protein